jgi:hypothetical protein
MCRVAIVSIPRRVAIISNCPALVKVIVEVEVEVRGVSATLGFRGISQGLVVVLSQWTVVAARTGCSVVSPRCLLSQRLHAGPLGLYGHVGALVLHEKKEGHRC